MLPPLKSTKICPVGTTNKRWKEAKRDKTKIGVGDSVTMKVQEIDEKNREGKIRRMMKELVFMYVIQNGFAVLTNLCVH